MQRFFYLRQYLFLQIEISMSIRNPIAHVITKKLTVTTMPVYESKILSICIKSHILSKGSLQVCILSVSFHYTKTTVCLECWFTNITQFVWTLLQIIACPTKVTTVTITHIPAVSIKLKDSKSRPSCKSLTEVVFSMTSFFNDVHIL